MSRQDQKQINGRALVSQVWNVQSHSKKDSGHPIITIDWGISELRSHSQWVLLRSPPGRICTGPQLLQVSLARLLLLKTTADCSLNRTKLFIRYRCLSQSTFVFLSALQIEFAERENFIIQPTYADRCSRRSSSSGAWIRIRSSLAAGQLTGECVRVRWTTDKAN